MPTPARAPEKTHGPSPSAPASPKKASHYFIPGTQIAMPRWAVHITAVIFVLGFAYTTLESPIIQLYNTYKQGKASLLDQAEAYRHFNETPSLHTSVANELGTIETSLFASDGCIAVIWHGKSDSNDSHTHFLRKLSDAQHEPPPGRIAGVRWLPLPWEASPAAVFASAYPSVPPPNRGKSDAQSPAGMQTPTAATTSPAPQTPHCSPSHPGPFETSYGETKGCWVQIWRTFSDGCKHYQWYNTCGKYLDTDANGVPRLYWTVCKDK